MKSEELYEQISKYGKRGCLMPIKEIKTMTLYVRVAENPDIVWKYRDVVAIYASRNVINFSVIDNLNGERIGYTIRNVISCESN